MPAKVLIEALSDTDKITEWNKTLTQAKVLKVLNDECVISYQVGLGVSVGLSQQIAPVRIDQRRWLIFLMVTQPQSD